MESQSLTKTIMSFRLATRNVQLNQRLGLQARGLTTLKQRVQELIPERQKEALEVKALAEEKKHSFGDNTIDQM